MNDEEFEQLFARILGQVSALGLAMLGYRGFMRFVLGYGVFWWFDVAGMVFGVLLLMYFHWG